jgi:pimeloyl-ACP methyl ester carboxylesterase
MLKSKWARGLSRVIQFLAILYLGLLLLVFFAQRKLLYQPTKASYETLLKIAQGEGYEPWQNSSGEFIGWKQISPVKQSHGRLLIVHGNAGCAVDRTGYADGLKRVAPLDVYILEYPGYGARGGSPSQKSIFLAASEGMELLKKDGPVYVMGESLGTGVAAYLAGTYPETVAGLLLIAPYHNLIDVAQAHMRIFPVALLLLDRFPSARYLQNYRGPVAMLFAGRDVIVPNRFGHALYDGYQGPKKFWEVPLAGHNDLLEQTDEWWQGVAAFWKANAVPGIERK